jgi:hypothetical protein
MPESSTFELPNTATPDKCIGILKKELSSFIAGLAKNDPAGRLEIRRIEISKNEDILKVYSREREFGGSRNPLIEEDYSLFQDSPPKSYHLEIELLGVNYSQRDRIEQRINYLLKELNVENTLIFEDTDRFEENTEKRRKPRHLRKKDKNKKPKRRSVTYLEISGEIILKPEDSLDLEVDSLRRAEEFKSELYNAIDSLYFTSIGASVIDRDNSVSLIKKIGTYFVVEGNLHYHPNYYEILSEEERRNIQFKLRDNFIELIKDKKGIVTAIEDEPNNVFFNIVFP